MNRFYIPKKIKMTATSLLLSAALVLPAPLAGATAAEISNITLTTNYAASAKTIKINKKTAILNVGDTLKLKLKNAPSGAKIKWTSSNSKVVKVSSSGKVTALKAGKATVTATYKKKQYKCTITVQEPKKAEYDMDLGGMEIIIRDWWSSPEIYEPSSEYEKAQREWQDYVQKEYNFTIKQVAISDWGSTSADYIDYVTTGGDDNNYIFVLRNDPAAVSAMNTGLMYDLATIPWLDFTQDKFTRNKVSEQFSSGSSVYAMNTGYSQPSTGVYFNKALLKEAGIDPDSLYDMQANGTWTWDKFEEICKKVQKDKDGDGQLDAYGLTLNETIMTIAAIYSNNGSFVGKNKNGYYYNLESANTMEALNWVTKIYNKYDEQAPEYQHKYKGYEWGSPAYVIDGEPIFDFYGDTYYDYKDEKMGYTSDGSFKELLQQYNLEYDKEYDICVDKENKVYYGDYISTGPDWDYYKTEFLSGNVAFLVDDAYMASGYSELEDANFEIGFVMFPKGPQSTTYVNCWSNNICVIPFCYSKNKAEKIAFAYNVYTEAPAGYEKYKDLSSFEAAGIVDSRAIKETISSMMDSKHGIIEYHSLIPNLSISDITWHVAPGANTSKLVDSVRDTWKKYIDDANNN